MDMRFGMWKVRSLYGAGIFITVAQELSDYKQLLKDSDDAVKLSESLVTIRLYKTTILPVALYGYETW
jgi:hypothetical protein